MYTPSKWQGWHRDLPSPFRSWLLRTKYVKSLGWMQRIQKRGVECAMPVRLHQRSRWTILWASMRRQTECHLQGPGWLRAAWKDRAYISFQSSILPRVRLPRACKGHNLIHWSDVAFLIRRRKSMICRQLFVQSSYSFALNIPNSCYCSYHNDKTCFLIEDNTTKPSGSLQQNLLDCYWSASKSNLSGLISDHLGPHNFQRQEISAYALLKDTQRSSHSQFLANLGEFGPRDPTNILCIGHSATGGVKSIQYLQGLRW